MAKINNITGLLAAMMAFVFMLSGCNNSINSVEEVIVAMEERASGISSFSADVNIKLDMDYTVDSVEDNMALLFKEDIDAVLESNEIYVEGTMNVTGVYDEIWESYIVEEGDGYASYSCIEGQWYYNEVDITGMEYSPSQLIDIIAGIDGYSLKKNIDYVLEARVDSEELISIMNCLYANIIESAFSEGVDISDMTGTATLRLDAVTCLPLTLKIVFDDCSDMFVGDDMFDSVNINEFVMDVELSEYDNTEDISVPANVSDLFKLPEGDDIYDDSEETQDASDVPDFEDEDSNVVVDGEGYYELTDYEGNTSVNVKAPEGYTFSIESDSAMIFFDRDGASADNYCTLTYEMAEISDSNTKEDVEGYMETYYNFYGTDDAYKNMEYIDNQSTEINGRTVNYSGMKYYYEGDDFTQSGYYTLYYYWLYIGDYVVTCSVTDYAAGAYADYDAASMVEMFFKDIVID